MQGHTNEQIKALEERNKKLYLAFRDMGVPATGARAAQKAFLIELAKRYRLSYAMVGRYLTMYKRHEWEEFSPVYKEVKLAPVVRWVPSDYIEEPTKQLMMSGKTLDKRPSVTTLQWRGQTISLEG